MNSTISSTSTDALDLTAALVRGAFELGKPLLYMHYLAESDWCNAEKEEEPASLFFAKVERVAICASSLRSIATSELKRNHRRKRLIETARLNRIAENAALVEGLVCQAREEFEEKFRSRNYWPQVQTNSEPEDYLENKGNVLRKSPMAGGSWQQLRDAVNMLIAELPQEAQTAYRLAVRLTREYCPAWTCPNEVASDLEALAGHVPQLADIHAEGFTQMSAFDAAEMGYDLLQRIPDFIDQRLPVASPGHLELRLDPEARRLWRGSESVSLTKIQTELAKILLRNGDSASPRPLLRHAWCDCGVSDNTMDQAISGLRKLVRTLGVDIKGYRREGYRLVEYLSPEPPS